MKKPISQLIRSTGFRVLLAGIVLASVGVELVIFFKIVHDSRQVQAALFEEQQNAILAARAAQISRSRQKESSAQGIGATPAGVRVQTPSSPMR